MSISLNRLRNPRGVVTQVPPATGPSRCWLKWIWKLQGLEVKGFSVAAALCELRLKRPPEAFSPPPPPTVIVSIHSPSSVTYCFSLCFAASLYRPHFTFIASKEQNKKNPRPTSESHSALWFRNRGLFISLSGDTHHPPHFIYPCVFSLMSLFFFSSSSFWLALKMACFKDGLPFFFLRRL